MGIENAEKLKDGFFDVVVIGSGAGGGVMGALLASRGLNVAIIEEGDYIPPEELPTNTGDALKRLYRYAGAYMILGNPPIAFAEGRCVGGSTVINGGMCWRTPEKVLMKWKYEEGIEWAHPESLENYFDSIENRISVREQPEETWSKASRLFYEGAKALGWKVLVDRRNQKGCKGMGMCMLGCPVNAKQSVLHTYIQDALRDGATLIPELRADSLIFKDNRCTEVICVTRSGKRVRIKGKVVVLSAGADMTPFLLMKSGFKSPSGMLGKNLATHPNIKVIGVFDEEIDQWKGAHQAHQIREFQDEGLVLATAGVPPFFVALSSESVGRELGEFMKEARRMLFAGVLLEDTGRGVVKNFMNRNPIMIYNLNDYDFYRLRRGAALLSLLLFTVGAKKVILPFRSLPEIKSPDHIYKIFDSGIKKEHLELMTVHIMGTAKMSREPKRGVTDMWGRVYGVENLFVADASLFPSPVGVNPMLSIMAVSMKVGDYIFENWGRFKI